MRSLRRLTWAVVLIASGCANDGAAGQDMASLGGQDLSASNVDDMTAANDDLSSSTGCHGLEICLAGCKGKVGCQMMCRTSATSKGKKLATKLNDCRQATCYVQDGGAEPCVFGMPASAMCTLCLKDSDTAPGMCTGGGTPSWCGACYQEFVACENDLP